MRSTILRIVVIIFVLHLAASDEGYKFCKTQMGQAGDCRNIKMCKSLLSTMLIFRERAGDFLRRTVCGMDGLDPLVCCPLINDDNDNKNVEKKNSSSPYEPLLEPVCGTVDSRFIKFVSGPIAKLGNYPWVTILGYQTGGTPNVINWGCGGSLISSRHVLTAAQCVQDRTNLYLARVGDLNLASDEDGANPIDLIIAKRTVHPQFDGRIGVNDIAVLELQDDIAFTDLIKPICLPVPDTIRYRNFEGSLMHSIGWDAVEFKDIGLELLVEVKTPIVHPTWCKEALRKYSNVTIDERVVCVSLYSSVDNYCGTDSGGSLAVPVGETFHLIGVNTFRNNCNEPGYPAVYTKVTSFLDFILSNMN